MKIRFIKKEDVPKATNLYHSIWPEDEFSRIKKYFELQVKNKEIFVAVEKKEIIGILGFSKRFFEKSDFLEEIIVHEKYRKKGIGKKLMKKFEADAKKRKTRRVFSSIEPKNKMSIKMHKKLGYKKSGHIKHIWKEGQKELILSKKLE